MESPARHIQRTPRLRKARSMHYIAIDPDTSLFGIKKSVWKFIFLGLLLLIGGLIKFFVFDTKGIEGYNDYANGPYPGQSGYVDCSLDDYACADGMVMFTIRSWSKVDLVVIETPWSANQNLKILSAASAEELGWARGWFMQRYQATLLVSMNDLIDYDGLSYCVYEPFGKCHELDPADGKLW